MLGKYEQLKYISKLPIKNLKKSGKNFRCSCVSCHEGSSPNKARMYFLAEGNRDYITIYCFNCGFQTNLKTFLKMFFPSVYDEYCEEEKKTLINQLKFGIFNKKNENKKIDNEELGLKYIFKLGHGFKPAKNFSKVVEYCKKRKIEKFIDDLYYCLDKKNYANEMLIFPFKYDKERVYGFQGRHPEYKKFYTHSFNEGFKVFNIFDVDKSKPIIITESIIDSLMVNNSISMLGSDLAENVKKYLKDSNLIFAFDNDSTGINKSLKYLNEGAKVFIWPNEIKYKDFNEFVINENISESALTKLVYENSLNGFAGIAKLKLKMSLRKR